MRGITSYKQRNPGFKRCVKGLCVFICCIPVPGYLKMVCMGFICRARGGEVGGRNSDEKIQSDRKVQVRQEETGSTGRHGGDTKIQQRQHSYGSSQS